MCDRKGSCRESSFGSPFAIFAGVDHPTFTPNEITLTQIASRNGTADLEMSHA